MTVIISNDLKQYEDLIYKGFEIVKENTGYSFEKETIEFATTSSVRYAGRCKTNMFGWNTEIELSKYVLDSENLLMTTIIHEILHAKNKLNKHDGQWKKDANTISSRTKYLISTFLSKEDVKEIDLKIYGEEGPKYKYEIVCESCNRVIKRKRESNVTKNPENYRCHCGGKLFIRSI